MIYILIYIIGQFFIGPNHNYSILLNDDLNLVKIDTINEKDILYTFVGGINNIDYSFTIITTSSKDKDFLLQTNVESYQLDCECQVTEKEKVTLNNFNTVKYVIEKKVEGIKFKGYFLC